MPLKALNDRIAAHKTQLQKGRTATIQLGLFRNHTNAERLAGLLASYGQVTSKPVVVKGAVLTSVALTDLRDGIRVRQAIAAAERAGAKGAYLVR